MKATETNLLSFLNRSHQFTIPIYQRTYSWTERECKQFWDDVLRTGKKDSIPSHFIGSIVYIEEGIYQVSHQSPLLVIDGQQRLTTVSLIIEALARRCADREPLPGFSERKLRNYYLCNPEEQGESYYKLLLTQTDKQSLLSLVKQGAWPANFSKRIKENFEFFEKKINELSDLKPLCKGLEKLIIVDISLSRDQDKPQLIFESMNSTGRELSQADLIRNFILMGLEKKHQKNLYENHWRPMELDFGQEADFEHFDQFMRHYLTIKTGDIPNKNKVYERFKEYYRNNSNSADNVVKEMQSFVTYYCSMALDKETDKNLKAAFNDLKELKVNVSYPFLLQVYDDYKKGDLSAEDFEHIIRLVESYVFRRWVCDIPTNSLNKTFAAFSRDVKDVKKDQYKESVEAFFSLLTSYRRFPKDDEFFREIKTKELYPHRSSYWLRKLENHNRKEQVNVNEYTVEHILPQNKKLSSKWREALGHEWKSIQEDYLHTLGNLTLTGYNSEYRDKFFLEKRDMKGGFKESPLRLNKNLRELETWDKENIKKRAEKLAQKALKVWLSPSLPSNILDNYHSRENRIEKPVYSIESYPPLADDSMRTLFKSFQKEILALDPCIKESFKPNYISYEAEQIFVYLLPQRKRLKLFIGLEIHELDDSQKKTAKDASDKHYGFCNVELDINPSTKLPYVMSLVRQALEKQI